MLHIIAKINNKIQLKLNKIGFVSHPSLSIGKNFRLGNYTTFIIHPTSKALFGNDIEIRNNFNLVLGKNVNLTIGDNVFLNNACSINCLESIVIGKNTLFGENVKLYDHNHSYNEKEVFPKDFTTKAIKIGENCWLGSNSIILKGVNIGNNVIIGAGCVIHKDIPDNTIIVNKQEYKNVLNE